MGSNRPRSTATAPELTRSPPSRQHQPGPPEAATGRPRRRRPDQHQDRPAAPRRGTRKSIAPRTAAAAFPGERPRSARNSTRRRQLRAPAVRPHLRWRTRAPQDLRPQFVAPAAGRRNGVLRRGESRAVGPPVHVGEVPAVEHGPKDRVGRTTRRGPRRSSGFCRKGRAVGRYRSIVLSEARATGSRGPGDHPAHGRNDGG